ncbi:hypothetical protein [Streptomyces sp. enrichment culture]|uniref:hypothetical protein n=1 Tax=Streptomyces sp. enrichment culture TaxID=1795815 RepID=UPI003F560EC6
MSDAVRDDGTADVRITAVGHADLTPDTLALVESALRRRLERLVRGPAVVRSGAGAALAFGRAARAAGRRLVVAIPSRCGVPALPPPRDRMATGELLTLADRVRLLDYDPADRDACVCADERMVADSRLLLAVWDGSRSDGRDATAHLVAYARGRGVPVEVVWPHGAAREPARAAPDGPAPARRSRPSCLPAAPACRHVTQGPLGPV